MEKENTSLLVIVIGIIALFLAALSQPYFEARTFNKFRTEGQTKATYMDAFFAELRVQSE